jgi:hypothetical protein
MVVLSCKKLVTHRTMNSGVFLFRRLSRRRVYKTLSNTPEISMHSIVATRCFPGRFQIVWTCSVSSWRAVSVDLPFLASIYVSGRVPLSSASFESLRAITSSSSFPIVLRRAIGLYAPIRV